MEAAAHSSRCVHCGGPVPMLFRRYSATVLKMMSCAHCGQVADKYVEYDPVLVLLDLVLLNRQAIRHILYNTAFRNHWKLCVVMVLIEGYVTYTQTPSEAAAAASSSPSDPWRPDGPHLDGERLFYVICVESLLASAAFFVASALGCRALGARVAPLRLCKALVLGSFAVFLWVPALIWTQPAQAAQAAQQADGGEPSRRWVDAAFIGGYTFLGLVQTVSVLCAAPRTAAAAVVALGLAAKAASRAALRALDLPAVG